MTVLSTTKVEKDQFAVHTNRGKDSGHFHLVLLIKLVVSVGVHYNPVRTGSNDHSFSRTTYILSLARHGGLSSFYKDGSTIQHGTLFILVQGRSAI